MTRALLLLPLLLAGCDSTGADVVALDDVLVVDLVEGPVASVRFVTEGTPGCYQPIAHRTQVARDLLTVDVDGLEVETGPVCRAITPSSFVVALPPGASRVEVRHRGRADAYAVRYQDDARVLVPVRTSVTRPGPR